MRFSAIILVLLSIGTFAQAEWTKVDSGTLAWLRDIQFIDANTGWIVGSAGTLLKSEDGGNSWKRQAAPCRDDIIDVHFVDRVNGWLLCERDIHGRSNGSISYLVRTADGGQTWEPIELGSGQTRLSKLFSSPNGRTFAIGEMGAFWTNAGGNWNGTLLPAQSRLTDGVFLSEVRAVMVGGLGTLLVSEDRGVTWEEAKIHGRTQKRKLNTLYFLDERLGWAAGDGGSLLRTENSGKDWTFLPTDTVEDISKLIFFDANRGIAVGAGGTVYRTMNGGKDWTRAQPDAKNKLYGIASNGSAVFAVGFGGTITKYQ